MASCDLSVSIYADRPRPNPCIYANQSVRPSIHPSVSLYIFRVWFVSDPLPLHFHIFFEYQVF